MEPIVREIRKLKEERDAVILAHYYVDEAVQELADYVGDSYYLSKVAMETDRRTILFCGVVFMGESAKLLNPEKTVLMPDLTADCPMAHMASVEAVEEIRRTHPDAAVVCYINSTAEIKAVSDVIVTSSNAVKIVDSLPNSEIYFIPDRNLAHYVATQLPEKTFLYHPGYCPVHQEITAEQVRQKKAEYPEAEFLVHPECPAEVLALADYVGSTSGIIEAAAASKADVLLIGTETGVFYQMAEKCPGKTLIPVRNPQICADMKKVTLEKVRDALKNMAPTVELPGELIERASRSLARMHQLANTPDAAPRAAKHAAETAPGAGLSSEKKA